jgi:hypothetical protein
MDINLLYLDMPCKIKGFAYELDVNYFIIAINTKLNAEQQEEAYLHELQHIYNGDFDKENIDLIELLISKLA